VASAVFSASDKNVDRVDAPTRFMAACRRPIGREINSCGYLFDCGSDLSMARQRRGDLSVVTRGHGQCVYA